MRDLDHRATFEQHGEAYVRVLAERFDGVGHEARAWLAERQAAREEAAAKLRDAREEETLQLAKAAQEMAERCDQTAKRSMMLARIAVIVSAASLLVAAGLVVVLLAMWGG